MEVAPYLVRPARNCHGFEPISSEPANRLGILQTSHPAPGDVSAAGALDLHRKWAKWQVGKSEPATPMGLYSERILPWLTALTMRNRLLAPYRQRLVPLARGRVLEVGIGSGLNLPLYGTEVEFIVGLDPSAALLRRAAAMAARAGRPLALVQASAEAIPLADDSIDSVVMTWTLCSIADATAALAEMRRVLKPDGALLFVEHGLSPQARVAAWQHRLDPLWVRVSCHLDNPVERMLREAGFALDDLKTGYLGRGPKPLSFMYEGRARPG